MGQCGSSQTSHRPSLLSTVRARHGDYMFLFDTTGNTIHWIIHFVPGHSHRVQVCTPEGRCVMPKGRVRHRGSDMFWIQGYTGALGVPMKMRFTRQAMCKSPNASCLCYAYCYTNGKLQGTYKLNHSSTV